MLGLIVHAEELLIIFRVVKFYTADKNSVCDTRVVAVVLVVVVVVVVVP
jgi:hypothetical protein